MLPIQKLPRSFISPQTLFFFFSPRRGKCTNRTIDEEPTKSTLSLVNLLCSLQNYGYIAFEWSPFGHLAPACSYPRPDCVSKVEETSEYPHYSFRSGPCFEFYLTRVPDLSSLALECASRPQTLSAHCHLSFTFISLKTVLIHV